MTPLNKYHTRSWLRFAAVLTLIHHRVFYKCSTTCYLSCGPSQLMTASSSFSCVLRHSIPCPCLGPDAGLALSPSLVRCLDACLFPYPWPISCLCGDACLWFCLCPARHPSCVCASSRRRVWYANHGRNVESVENVRGGKPLFWLLPLQLEWWQLLLFLFPSVAWLYHASAPPENNTCKKKLLKSKYWHASPQKQQYKINSGVKTHCKTIK